MVFLILFFFSILKICGTKFYLIFKIIRISNAVPWEHSKCFPGMHFRTSSNCQEVSQSQHCVPLDWIRLMRLIHVSPTLTGLFDVFLLLFMAKCPQYSKGLKWTLRVKRADVCCDLGFRYHWRRGTGSPTNIISTHHRIPKTVTHEHVWSWVTLRIKWPHDWHWSCAETLHCTTQCSMWLGSPECSNITAGRGCKDRCWESCYVLLHLTPWILITGL